MPGLKRTFTFLILIPILLGACSRSAKSSVIKLREKNNGQSIEVKRGERIKVILNGNPTTGFQWEVKAIDATILKQAGQPDFKPESTAVGAGGKITLDFEAIGAGQTRLELVYLQVSQQGVAPSDTFAVTVKVK